MQNIEFPSLNRVINSINLKILEHGYLTAGEEWKFFNLSSPFNRMYFIVSGLAQVSNNDNKITMETGNVYLVPLDNTYNYECPKELQKFYIHFRIEYLPGHDLFEGHKYCGSLPIDAMKLQTLIACAQSNDIGSIITLEAILLEYVGQFVLKASQNVNDQIALTHKNIKLYDYINNHCVASLRVMDLAEYMEVSLSKLSRDFKNDTGTTLKHYIDAKIVHKAQELLLTTALSVKEVSDKLDFLDEFHFSRFFKRNTNISPSKYRLRNNLFK